MKEREVVGNRITFIGFSTLMIMIIYAVYAIGVMAGLLVFGQLSDRVVP